jgi:hypothetical protein
MRNGYFAHFKHDPRLARKFMEPPIKALAVFRRLSVKLIKYKEQAVEIKEILSAPMDQHRFAYANTCEDLFFKWSECDRNNPLH